MLGGQLVSVTEGVKALPTADVVAIDQEAWLPTLADPAPVLLVVK
jgi:hypothetical protein